MSATEETIDATLDANGQLRLSHQPSLAPGPVRVTIRAGRASGRGLADVVRDMAAEQRSRDLPGRSAAEVQAEEDARQDEDAARDRELDAARQGHSGPCVRDSLG